MSTTRVDEKRRRKRGFGGPFASSKLDMSSSSMDQQNDSEAFRGRLFWTTVMDRAFLEFLVEYSLNGGKEGTKFKKEAWREMLVRFNQKMNMNIDVDQLKNRTKFYRHEYNLVKGLKNHPKFAWDEKKQVLIADDTNWVDYVAKNPAARSYKQKSVPTFRQLEIIFGNTKDMGSSAPYVDGLEGLEEDTSEGMDPTEVTEVSKPCLESKDDLNYSVTVAELANLVPTDSVKQPSTVVDQQKRRRTSSASTSRHAEKEHRYQSNGVEAVVSSPLDASERKASGAGLAGTESYKRLDECMAELNAIEGLDDDLYVKALFILRDEYNRCVFLNTGGRRRLAWLRAATRGVEV